jgi:UDP-2-acetamido-2,6-beta-L-arabino-hexul-4-ose reductase
MSASSIPNQLTVAVTGSSGLFGWHLRCFLKTQATVKVICLDRKLFADDDQVLMALQKADVVVHLAGLNRGEDSDIFETNVSLTKRLIESLETLGRVPHVVFANSTHRTRETAYGRSKNISAGLLKDWADKHGAKFSDVVFPHLFGEHGKPFYNSVVSTFCYQIAKGEKLQLLQDSEIEPLHLSQASECLWTLIQDGHSGQTQVPGRKIKVSDLAQLISRMDHLYKGNVLPDLQTPFEEFLFNTYRSYVFSSLLPINMELKSDARGTLFEAVKTREHGQCFLSTTRPGFTRGNHFHIKKFERFFVVKGEAVIRLRKLFSDEVIEYKVSGLAPCAVDIPTLHTHNITNTGTEDLITLFWSGEIFDPLAPDTYGEPVEPTHYKTHPGPELPRTHERHQ